METPNRILHTVVASLAAAAFFIFTACTAAPQADIYTTTATADRLFDHTRQALESRSRDTLPAITIDTASRLQPVYGFGAAITGSTCYNLLRMSLRIRHQTFPT